MEKNKSEQNGFEKKSERLDIRVSHQKKQAFSRACEDQGDTPSSAVRRFISSYIRRSKRDDIGASLRAMPWRKASVALLILIVVGFSGQKLWTANGQYRETKIADKVFKIYDENGNGIIELGEIAPNDNHLHRVLNIDGEDGISRDEFITHATMVWRFVDPDNFKIIKNDKGLFKHTMVSRSLASVAHDGTTKIPTTDPALKKYIMIDGKPVEFKNDDEIAKNIKSVTADYETVRKLGGLPDLSGEHMRKFNVKFVKFNLGDPDRLELTVLEQQNNGFRSESMKFQRSVTWVEGRKTPEVVMGLGRDVAVLTQEIPVN